MATVTTTARVYCPLPSTVVVTPSASARVIVDDRESGGAVIRVVSAEESFSVPAGGSIQIEAIGGDVTYTSTVSIQSPDGGVYALVETTPTKSAISASATVHTGSGEFAGYNVNSFSSSPTLTVYDNTAGSGKAIYGPVTISATGPVFLPRALLVDTGVYFTISGTLNVTPYAG